MARFRVTNRGSVLTNNNDLRKPGETVDTDEIGKAVTELLRDGKIVQVEGDRIEVKPTITSPTVKTIKTTEDGEIKVIEPVTQTIKTENKPVGKLTGTWTLKPEEISGKSLEELNTMIIERDATVQPFADKAEAIAFLSQDLQ